MEEEKNTSLIERKDEGSKFTLSLTEIEKAAEYLIKSGFTGQYKTKEDAVMAALHGRALGLDVTTSWNHIFMIKGRACLSAKMMLGLIKDKCPEFRMKILQRDDKRAAIRVWEHYKTEPEFYEEFEYTIEDAKNAGDTEKKGPDGTKDSNMYIRRPKTQLFARVISNMANAIYPNIVAGLYTKEEVEFFEDKEYNDFDQKVNPKPEHKNAIKITATEIDQKQEETKTIPVESNAKNPKLKEIEEAYRKAKNIAGQFRIKLDFESWKQNWFDKGQEFHMDPIEEEQKEDLKKELKEKKNGNLVDDEIAALNQLLPEEEKITDEPQWKKDARKLYDSKLKGKDGVMSWEDFLENYKRNKKIMD